MADKLRSYAADGVTVTWSAMRCIHFQACVRSLPEVFDTEQKPWIQPGEASGAEVLETVLRCPTGALHFESAGGPGESVLRETVPSENTVTVAPDGPLYVRGDVVLKNSAGETLLRDTRVALCRCGASGHKPFCDGSHTKSEFRDPGSLAQNKLKEDDTGATSVTFTAAANGPLRLSGPLTLRSVDGATIYEGSGGALCRCGASKHKPFCDGTHAEVGFEAD